MLPYLLGAGLGGFSAYQQSRGDLGATLLGAGLGAVTPGVLRMAGSALGGTLAGTGLAQRAGSAMLGGAAKLGQVAANAPGTLQGGIAAANAANLAQGARVLSSPALSARLLPKIGGAAAVGAGLLLGAPQIAGAVASNIAPGARRLAGGGGGLAYSGMQPGSSDYNTGAAVPGDLPVGAQPYNTAAVLDPSGALAANRINQLMQGDVELANLRKMLPEINKAAEARSKAEFSRNMAAAGIRQNIATAAQMLMQSQLGAQQMGQTAAQQAGQALTQQYQYS